jgi:PAS domain S-box-containing protein
MASAEELGNAHSAASEQVNDLFDFPEFAKAVETEEFKQFLDHLPIAIVISKLFQDDQRIIFANKAYEEMTGRRFADIRGRRWSILEAFKSEDDPNVTMEQALLKWEDYLGTFRLERAEPILVDGYAGIIEGEDGVENYRIVAIVDVTARERAQREEFARKLQDRDTLLKELQHRVRNNLQLITALIRIDARNQREGSEINLDRLAGRIESLQLLYKDLSAGGLGQTVELGHYISEIAGAVMHTYAVDGIRLDLKVDHAPASVNVAMPIGLIVNELLTNAFKHAFTGGGGGTLTVRCLHQEGSKYRVVVADDGIGLPEGATWPVPGKLGTLLVQALRENTKNMQLTVETAPGKGTRVTFDFEHKPSLPKPQ